MIRVRFLPNSSTNARALSVIVLRPVRYPRASDSRPITIPPVGKSGPGTIARSSPIVTSGESINRTSARQTSPRLCGGMLVAMPTAMPPAPLTTRLGNRLGSTTGSVLRSS